MYVIDASVAIKWFVDEEDSPAARKLRATHVDGTTPLAAPDLLIYETANVLLRSRGFSLVETKESIQQLYDLNLDIIAPTPDLVMSTISLSSQKGITFYDALYVELARQLGFKCLTADRKLFARLKDISLIQSITPDKHP